MYFVEIPSLRKCPLLLRFVWFNYRWLYEVQMQKDLPSTIQGQYVDR